MQKDLEKVVLSRLARLTAGSMDDVVSDHSCPHKHINVLALKVVGRNDEVEQSVNLGLKLVSEADA